MASHIRTTSQAFIALGSNIDAERNLPAAVRELLRYGTIQKISSVWETAPVGFLDQPHFLNAVLLLQTRLNIFEIRTEMIPQIEKKLLRIRDPLNKNGPRTIDVDLAMYDATVQKDNNFHLPDPDILTRPFLAGLLAEIAPQFVHPTEDRTLSEIAHNIPAATNLSFIRTDIDLRKILE